MTKTFVSGEDVREVIERLEEAVASLKKVEKILETMPIIQLQWNMIDQSSEKFAHYVSLRVPEALAVFEEYKAAVAAREKRKNSNKPRKRTKKST